MVSPVFFRRFPQSSLSLSRPLPTLSPSLIGHLASVDVKQHEIFCFFSVFCCCCFLGGGGGQEGGGGIIILSSCYPVSL